MHIVVGHHRLDDQSVAVRVVDEVCITFFESNVVIFHLELLYRPLVHAVDIGEWPLFRLSDVSFLRPTRFSGEVRSTKDRLDFLWGFCLRCIILWPGPPVINGVLEVPAVDEFLNLILKCNALFSRVTDVLVVSAIFTLIPFGEVSTQRVRLLEYSSLFRGHEDVLS